MNQLRKETFAVGSWAFSSVHGDSVRILDVETVWNHTVYQVWIPRLGAVERVSGESLTPAQSTEATGIDRIIYAVAAARIADALTQDVLLAPLEAGVIPLPHQLYALTRAVTDDKVRLSTRPTWTQVLSRWLCRCVNKRQMSTKGNRTMERRFWTQRWPSS